MKTIPRNAVSNVSTLLDWAERDLGSREYESLRTATDTPREGYSREIDTPYARAMAWVNARGYRVK